MSEPQRVLYTALEGIVVADANRTGRLAGKAAQDDLIGLVNGVNLAASAISFVREGLLAVVGAGLSVDIQAGELCRFDAAVAVGADESRYHLARQATTINVPLAAADPGQPRIDLIHAAETSTASDSQVRNFINVTTRVVTPAPTNKLQSPTMNLAVVTGTPGATPAFPALPANRVPLWYVYIPAAAAAVTDGHLMDCRQYIRSNDVVLSGSYRATTMMIGTDSASAAVIRLSGGVANVVGGGVAALGQNLDYTLAQLLQAGDPNPPAALVQIDLYVVAGGNGVPIGKTQPGNLVPVARNGDGANQPSNTGGPPAGGVTYYPLLSLGLTNVQFNTLKASYIGTILTDATTPGDLQPYGGGLALDRGGDVMAKMIGTDGSFPAINTHGRNPTLRYGSATTVTIAQAMVVMAGTPIPISAPVTFTMPTDLTAPDVEAASTWYYCYLRLARPQAGIVAPRAAQRQLVARISSEAPNALGQKPTPEAGLTSADYCFVGSFFNNAGLNIEPFFRSGDVVMFQSRNNAAMRLHNADLAISPAFTTLTAIAPLTAKYALITVDSRLLVTADEGDTQLFLFHEDGIAVSAYAPVLTVGVGGGTTATEHDHWMGLIALNTANQAFRASRAALTGTGAAFNLDLWQIGYVEDVTFSDP